MSPVDSGLDRSVAPGVLMSLSALGVGLFVFRSFAAAVVAVTSPDCLLMV